MRGASWSAMRRSEGGVKSSGRSTSTSCVADGHNQTISGTWRGVITINGKRQHLGWAVVQDILVTDKLASYGVAHRRLMRSVEHLRSKYLNNRDVRRTPIKPTRRRERAMKRFTSPDQAQLFLNLCSAGEYHHTSSPAATGSAPSSPARRWPPVSPPGTSSPDWARQSPDHSATATPPDPRLPRAPLSANNLTVPDSARTIVVSPS